jgi:hypothetical protein
MILRARLLHFAGVGMMTNCQRYPRTAVIVRHRVDATRRPMTGYDEKLSDQT